jgi:protein LSM14
MNEKFKKDDIWGELGHTAEEASPKEDGEVKQPAAEEKEKEKEKPAAEGTENEPPASDDKKGTPVYEKDDFFDSISCEALEREHGDRQRSKFSEQRRVDVEVRGQLLDCLFLVCPFRFSL